MLVIDRDGYGAVGYLRGGVAPCTIDQTTCVAWDSTYWWKLTPLTIAMAMIAAATKSMVMQNAGHHRVLAT